MAVVTLNVHFRGLRGSEVPKSVKKIFLGGLAKIVFMQFNPTYHVEKSTESGTFQDRIKVSKDKILIFELRKHPHLIELLQVQDHDQNGGGRAQCVSQGQHFQGDLSANFVFDIFTLKRRT